MKRRWIIRGFFISLLLLCVGGWVWSSKLGLEIGYCGGHTSDVPDMWEYRVDCVRGEIVFGWLEHFDSTQPLGWSFRGSNPNSIYWHEDGDFYLGFLYQSSYGLLQIAIPFYFPTTISTALVVFVWRKTRPPLKGGAFPVEAAKASPNFKGIVF
jgi:hypothetical protein